MGNYLSLRFSFLLGVYRVEMSRGMRFPTIWYVQPAKALQVA